MLTPAVRTMPPWGLSAWRRRSRRPMGWTMPRWKPRCGCTWGTGVRAVQVCSRFPRAHGAPVHLGDPAAIGVRDLDRPDYGDSGQVTDSPGLLQGGGLG